MRPSVWEPLEVNEDAAAELGRCLGVTPITARILSSRGFDDENSASRFLNPSVDHLHNPLKLTDMARTIDRLLAAAENSERVAVHGDYDADGITSTVMLTRALQLLGVDVIYFIPDRFKDGYGLEPSGIDRLHNLRAKVIVTVDCGIRGGAAAQRCRELGIDLIVTDHHMPSGTLPSAFSVINPKRSDCVYPEKNLSGAGVALKLVQALCEKTGNSRWLSGFIKIAAIGTLADVVPLVGENRVIAKVGLKLLSQGPHTVGLRALLESSGLSGKKLDGFHISFILAPRINAAGRMGAQDLATRLLLVNDESMAGEARELAAKLEDENLKRRNEENATITLAKRVIEKDPSVGAHNILVVYGEDWHRGVIGIVASRLVDRYHRPVVVLSVDGELAHGSCRSVPGFDVLQALEKCDDLLVRFGGHRQAAGLTINTSCLKEFRKRLCDYANMTLEPDDLKFRLKIDGTLNLDAISSVVAADLEQLAPFGMGNPRPVFRTGPVKVIGKIRRLKRGHLAMTVSQGGRRFRAVAWRGIEHEAMFEKYRESLQLAFSVVQNYYHRQNSLEIEIVDAKGN